MARTVPTVEEITSDFPHPTVPGVMGEPTYEAIHTIHNILQENAASIHSNAGGGVHDHLTLVLTPAHYQQVTGHLFNPHIHPGANPPNPCAFLLQHDLQAQRDQYYATLYVFNICRNTDKPLVKQITT
eukprot:5003258-Ditylum_brightwellii.AAC.1